MMKWAISAALLAVPSVAEAQILLGSPVAIDGDTLDFGGMRVRLFGIDAPESTQACQRGGEAWACGQEARDMLSGLISDRQIRCQQRDRDTYDRIVATCTAGRIDLSDALARAGLAIALPEFSDAYVYSAAQAQAQRLGIWAGEFTMPATFRASDPEYLSQDAERARAREAEPARELARPARSREIAPQSPQGSAYYANCAQARAAGVAPLRRGQPGYRPPLDADGDGIACEPLPRQ